MTDQPIDLSAARTWFPALQETDEKGRPYVYFDGPGGTQVPQTVIDAMGDYFKTANANHGGRFVTSFRNDTMIGETRAAMADFLNAASADEIVFGANMTTLTYRFSRAIGRTLEPGDEIVVTHLDHDANIAPWKALAEQGVVIRQADFNPQDCRLDLDHLASQISDKTKLVAVGYASNAVGTINPIQTIARLAHQKGALLWVDAVHYAPHGPIDVQTLDCDFLVCSAYKFFGPHVGVLYGRLPVLRRLPSYKVRPADPEPPEKFETGTLNHEGLAGVKAAVGYLAQLGERFESSLAEDGKRRIAAYTGSRRRLKAAMEIIAAYERPLFQYLTAQMHKIPGVTVYGLTDPADARDRCPTLAFRHAAHSPADIAGFMGEHGIFVWDGNYYAIAVTERLGVEEYGGMVRVGLAHYNTKQEVDRFLQALSDLVS